MYEFAVGPVVVSARQIIPVASLIVALAGVRYLGPGASAARREALDQVSGLVLVAFAGWKLGPLLYQPRVVLENPGILLYAPGGVPGIVLAVLSVSAVLLRRWLRAGRPTLSGGVLRSDPRFILSGLMLAVAVGTGIVGHGVFFVLSASNNERASEFVLPAVGGGTAGLEELLGDADVVAINFWATWCGPCRAEAEVKNRVARRFEGDVTVVGINLTATEANTRVVEEYVDRWNKTYPVLLDVDGAVARQYNVRGTPTTVFVDSDGVIRDRHFGAMSQASARASISRARGGD